MACDDATIAHSLLSFVRHFTVLLLVLALGLSVCLVSGSTVIIESSDAGMDENYVAAELFPTAPQVSTPNERMNRRCCTS